MTRKVVVIGAGVAGMATALICAGQGDTVTLVEKAPQLGPNLRGFHRGGVAFDIGVHYLGAIDEHDIMPSYFRYLGLAPLTFIPFQKEGFERLILESSESVIDVPVGCERVADMASSLFPDDSSGISDYLDQVQARCSTSPFLNFDTKYAPSSSFHLFENLSVENVLNERMESPEARALFGVGSMLYGTPPSRAPFDIHAKVVGTYYRSAGMVEGGGEALTRSFVQALVDRGVECIVGAAVQTIELSASGAVAAVQLDNGRQLEADMCVCCTHPGILPELLPQKALRPVYRKRLHSLQSTPSAYAIFARCRRPVPEFWGRATCVLSSPDVEIGYSPTTPQEERPLWFYSTNYNGQQGLTIFTSGFFDEVSDWQDSSRTSRPGEYTEFKQRCTERILHRVYRLFPSLRGNLDILESATPLTFKDYLSSPGGGLYGPMHTVDQSDVLPMTKVPGLFLAGQATIAPGVLGAIVSSCVACGVIYGFETILEGVRSCR
ncbi:phytoene desaturase family protein [Desulfovibrio inopinatus]|uniref:phytoene desaturase family protein n=1 Tax=Desulfovibrio inopinatus TaxID=102109 RepID=UPI0004833255|nr:NAD(P)/FAD-dependent oxidoreductase [Desulfovibrio inopinatus]